MTLNRQAPYYFFLIVSIVLAMPYYAFGQYQDYPRFEQISIRPSQRIYSIIKDEQGFVWLGTFNGLLRFDGEEFRTYNSYSDDSSSFHSGRVLKVIQDSNKIIWCLTNVAGLSLFDPSQEKFLSPKNWPVSFDPKIIPTDIKSIHVSKSGRIWVGTNNGEIYGFDSDYELQYRFSLSEQKIAEIFEDSKGNLLLDTQHPQYFIHYNLESGKATNTYLSKFNKETSDPFFSKSFYEDSRGSLWVGTPGNGFYMFSESDTIEFKNEGTSNLSYNLVTSIIEDDKENIWVGSYEGIHIYNWQNEDVAHLQSNNLEGSLASNTIFSLYKDNQNIIWAGSVSSTLNLYNSKSNIFAHLGGASESVKGHQKEMVSTFVELSTSKFYFGTERGVYVISNLNLFEDNYGNNFNVDKVKGTEDKLIMSLTKDFRNQIWISTLDDGLSVLDPNSSAIEKINLFTDQGPIKSTWIWPVIQRSDQSMWIGIENGLVGEVDRDGKLTLVNVDFSTDGQLVNAMYEDTNDIMWIGFTESGVSYLDEESGTIELVENSELQKITVTSYLEDSKNRFWIGTARNGIYQYDRNTGDIINHYDRNDGLTSEMVSGIVEDNNENLWISSPNGLSKFNIRKESFLNYDKRNGLQDLDFELGSAYKSSEGLLFFGGNNGFNVFHPDNLKSDSTFTNLVFTELLVNNKSIEPGPESPISLAIPFAEGITLQANQTNFTIDFTALNIVSESSNVYEYKLEGFDEDWIIATDDQRATYTNLDPGNYIMRVKASNHFNEVSFSELSLPILVEAFWWNTSWFLIFCILLFLLLIYSAYRIRLRVLLNQRKVMIRSVAEKTKELRTANQSLAEKNQQVITQREELQFTNKELKELTKNLESIIELRTKKLSDQNKRLIEYALFNAHNVRGPLVRIMGLSNVNSLQSGRFTLEEILAIIRESANELDQAIREINKNLSDEISDTEASSIENSSI